MMHRPTRPPITLMILVLAFLLVSGCGTARTQVEPLSQQTNPTTTATRTASPAATGGPGYPVQGSVTATITAGGSPTTPQVSATRPGFGTALPTGTGGVRGTPRFPLTPTRDEGEDILPPATPSPTGGATATATRTSPTPTRTRAPSATPRPGWCTSPPRSSTSTPGGSPTATPSLAASGPLRLAFLQEGRLWLWEQDQADPTPLAQTGGIVEFFAAGGRPVVFVRQAGPDRFELWAVEPDGSGERLLVSADEFARTTRQEGESGARPYQLAWIPGRRALLFSTQARSPDGESLPRADLWRLDLAGGLRELLPPGDGGLFAPSPDGRQVAVGSRSRLSLMDTLGNNRRENVLPGYQAVGLGAETFYPPLQWMPDASALRSAVFRPEDALDPHPLVEVWEVPMPGFEERLLVTGEGEPTSLRFSPGGDFAAYWRWLTPGENTRELHMLSLGGQRNPDLVYRVGARLEFLAWAPGGAGWAYYDPRQDTINYRPLCDAAVVLTDFPSPLGQFRWLDAERFLYISGSPGNWVVRLGEIGSPSQPVFELEDDPNIQVVGE